MSKVIELTSGELSTEGTEEEYDYLYACRRQAEKIS